MTFSYFSNILLKQTGNCIGENSCRWMKFFKQAIGGNFKYISALQSLISVRNGTELFYLNGETEGLKDSIETLKLR